MGCFLLFRIEGVEPEAFAVHGEKVPVFTLFVGERNISFVALFLVESGEKVFG